MSSSRGERDATAVSEARRPIASASIASRDAANVSANPLPPSGPLTTVVSDACVDGDQHRCPWVFARATSPAVVSYAPAAVHPSAQVATSAATPFARSSGEAVAVSSKNRSTLGTSAFGANPGQDGSGPTTSAISFAL